MKIILATGIFPPDIGGPATYIEKLALELNRRNISVGVVTYADKANSKLQFKIQNYNFPVIRISRRYPFLIRHFLYFWRLLWMAWDVDVIYAQNPVSAGAPAVLVSKILEKKLVLKVVGDAAWEKAREKNITEDDLEDFQKKSYGFFIGFIRWIQKYAATSAGFVIAPSFYLKKIVEAWGVSNNKIAVVYNAVDYFENMETSKEEAKMKLAISGDIILSVGRLSPWKGFARLIETMEDLIKNDPNFKLVIAGEGEGEKNLKSQISNLKLENNVKLVGKIDHEEMVLYFKTADIFILNSQYEGLSHSILEAMEYGVPIIASNKGGNPELIENGLNGFLVEYNNKNEIKEAILKLFQNKEIQEKFIFNSKEKLKKFTWENLVSQTLRVLN